MKNKQKTKNNILSQYGKGCHNWQPFVFVVKQEKGGEKDAIYSSHVFSIGITTREADFQLEVSLSCGIFNSLFTTRLQHVFQQG
jgi:hypothetical protein